MPSSDTEQPSVAVQVDLGNGTEVTVRRVMSPRKGLLLQSLLLGAATCVDAGYNPVASFRKHRKGSSDHVFRDTLFEAFTVMAERLYNASTQNQRDA